MTVVSPRLSGCPGRTGGDTPCPVASHSKWHVSHTHFVYLARKNDRHAQSFFKNDIPDCRRWCTFTLLTVETVSKKIERTKISRAESLVLSWLPLAPPSQGDSCSSLVSAILETLLPANQDRL
jgi:hypothetical protein